MINEAFKRTNFVEFKIVAEMSDPIHPIRDKQIYPRSIKFFTLEKSKNSYGFSIATTKKTSDESLFDHVITRVKRDGPAELSGIEPNMNLLSINGKETRYLKHYQVVRKVSTSSNFLIVTCKIQERLQVQHFRKVTSNCIFVQ